MGAMGDHGRLGIILLVITFLASSIFISSPFVASNLQIERPMKTLAATQYDPSALFQSGVCFNDYSWAINVDPGVKDFAIGDLNGDGLKDLATISTQTDSICIYNRTASGFFNPIPWRISNPNVVDMRSIVIGDLLGKDGNNDIAVSYNGSTGQGKLCIFDQSNGFIGKILDLSNTEPFQLVIGHFSGSDNSLTVVCRGDPSLNYDDYIEIWKYPFISFATDHRSISISTSPTPFTRSEFLVSGDINNDGKDDLIVGNRSGSNVCIMIQPSIWTGSWTTSTKQIAGLASDIKLADVLGNGRNDLVFANTANVGGWSQVIVYRNNGTGFDSLAQTPIKTYLGLGSIAMGEFSGALGIDLLTLCKSSANVSAYFRNLSSTWYGNSINLTFPVDENPLKAIIESTVPNSAGLFILSQRPIDGQSSITFFNASAHLKGNADKNLFIGYKSIGEIATGRMSNGNIITASVLPSSNEVLIYEQNSSRVRTLHTESGPIGLCMGRFNPDNDDDLAVLNSINGSVSIFNGSTLFTSNYPIKNITLPFAGSHAISAKSVRGDGFDDLAIVYDSGIYVLYCLENWQYFSPISSEALGVGIAGTRSALSWEDLNGDGISSDLAVLNSATDTVEVYIRDSIGSPGDFYSNIPSANLTDVGRQFVALAVGDLGFTIDQGNAGRIDIAVLTEGGNVLIYLQPNFGFDGFTFSYPNIRIDVGGEARKISAGDVNDDGLDDLMIGSWSLPQLAIYLRTGSLTFVNPFNLTTGAETSGFLAKDVDGDGRIDLMASSARSHSLSIWYQKNLEPKAAAVPSKYSEYEGRSISFTGNGSRDSFSDQSSLDYNWTFFPLTYKSGISVTYTFPQNGNYSVNLRVTDRGGLSNWSNLTMIVLDTSPTADFSILSNPAIEGTNVSFQDNSTPMQDPIVDHFWTFGDGTVASGAHVSHAYNRSGNFLITFRITDSDGTVNSTSKMISVINVNPVADFSYSPEVPLEGEAVQFNNRSFTFNYLVSWAWNFGDGGTSNLRDPVHTYQENGTYNVTLTVVESDNSSSIHYRFISIANTSPIIVSLRTADGKNSYAEDQMILFEVTTAPAHEPIVSYQWDLNFSGSFTATPQDSLVNHTFYHYTKSGTYEVSIRVWDHDSYREATQSQVLVIEITDPIPTASFNFRNVTSGTIQLDASSSSDNPSDVAGLLFSWNFNDGSGYSAWDTTSILNHAFAYDGEYSIKLRVKDDSNQINETTRTILIDRIAPYIFLSGESSSFLIGEAIQVSVTVYDPNGVSNVTLHYRINDAIEQILAMTPSGTTGIYVAQIPPQNHNCTISYWVTAADSSSNIRTTGHLVITVSATLAESQYIILALSAILIVIVILLLFMRNMMVPVDEVFIIYDDGRLMAHQTRRLKPGMDDEILSSMLVAIQSFVKDSFKDESSTHLQRLDFGEKKILVERGDSFYLAVVLHSHRAGNVPQRMQAVIADIHREYGMALNKWDGDLEKVRGVKDQTDKLFKSPIPLALPGLKKEKAPKPSECPICGFAVDPNDEKCPSCGAELAMSTADGLENATKSFEEAKDESK